jgi:hypothetical protein
MAAEGKDSRRQGRLRGRRPTTLLLFTLNRPCCWAGRRCGEVAAAGLGWSVGCQGTVGMERLLAAVGSVDFRGSRSAAEAAVAALACARPCAERGRRWAVAGRGSSRRSGPALAWVAVAVAPAAVWGGKIHSPVRRCARGLLARGGGGGSSLVLSAVRPSSSTRPGARAIGGR